MRIKHAGINSKKMTLLTSTISQHICRLSQVAGPHKGGVADTLWSVHA